jgi:carbamoyltransferase
MLVLGIGGFMHDYNCALVDTVSGQVAMCEAERLSRRKHHVILPDENLLLPIQQCCQRLGRQITEIEVVVFGHTDPFETKERLKKLLDFARFAEVDHHLCHAAAVFFSSPYDSALILSLDGFGDGSSGVIARGHGTHINVLERISDANSIGLEYLRATYHIGLGTYGAEGKTQGLASYGEPIWYDDYMNEIQITPEGNLVLSDLLRGETSQLAAEGGYLNALLLDNDFLHDHLPRRIAPEKLTEDHYNLAASIQKVLEYVALEMASIGKKRTNETKLVLGGGVCMNSSMNGKLLESGMFDGIFAFPMAADRGIGIGAALYYIHQMEQIPRFYQLKHTFYGGSFGDDVAMKAMQAGGLTPVQGADVAQIAAQAVADGKIVGWFQGASEMGARALGHRSILADPRRADMKDIVNNLVKHREWFRPFAPAILTSRAPEYFAYPENITTLEHMTFTVPTTEKAKADTPATTHVDGTARVQLVADDTQDNIGYANVIRYFDAITGVPVILNTSFNDKDEPIVETPDDAVTTFHKTDMDVLVIGGVYALRK